MKRPQIQDMIGQTFAKVYRSEDSEKLYFEKDDGNGYVFHHRQDCCENVEIVDICGDLKDLENSPILQAEETSNQEDIGEYGDSQTWTFYKFATTKGYVTVRWLGSSNGYYSESVDMDDLQFATNS